jgi:hypothetical protein
VNQFLASRNIDGTFKQTGWRFRQGNFLSLRYRCADDVAGRMRLLTPRAIMCCTPTLRWLIVLTLPPRYRCPLNRLPASRLLLPRSGLERSDFVPWHEAGVAALVGNVRCSG